MSQSKKRSVCDFEDDVDLRAALLRSSNGNGPLSTNSDDAMDWVLPSSDPATTYPQSMNEEVARLQVLKSYAILDTDKEVKFDRLTRLASQLFHTEIALVSLVDFARQWFKSSVGLDARETPRRFAFCSRKLHGLSSSHSLLTCSCSLQMPSCANTT